MIMATKSKLTSSELREIMHISRQMWVDARETVNPQAIYTLLEKKLITRFLDGYILNGWATDFFI